MSFRRACTCSDGLQGVHIESPGVYDRDQTCCVLSCVPVPVRSGAAHRALRPVRHHALWCGLHVPPNISAVYSRSFSTWSYAIFSMLVIVIAISKPPGICGRMCTAEREAEGNIRASMAAPCGALTLMTWQYDCARKVSSCLGDQSMMTGVRVAAVRRVIDVRSESSEKRQPTSDRARPRGPFRLL